MWGAAGVGTHEQRGENCVLYMLLLWALFPFTLMLTLIVVVKTYRPRIQLDMACVCIFAVFPSR